MTSIEFISASLHLGLALLILWVFVFHFWRQYRLDVLRERLFQVRAELFDYAASGQLSFDNPAYARLRVVINSMIRFAHKFTFTRIALIFLFRRRLERIQPPDPLAEWREAVSKLPEESQKVLQRLHAHMLAALVWHVTKGSPILFAIFVFYTVRSFAKGSQLEVDSLPAVDIVEAQAINAELQEQEQEYPWDEPTLATP